MNHYLLFLIVFVFSVGFASALECHQCSSLELEECRDPFIKDQLGECDDDDYCVKYKTVIWIRDSGYINGRERESSTVTRTCQPKKGKKEGCVGWQNNGGISIKCHCGSDGCNAGHSLTPRFLSVTFGCLLTSLALLLSVRH